MAEGAMHRIVKEVIVAEAARRFPGAKALPETGGDGLRADVVVVSPGEGVFAIEVQASPERAARARSAEYVDRLRDRHGDATRIEQVWIDVGGAVKDDPGVPVLRLRDHAPEGLPSPRTFEAMRRAAEEAMPVHRDQGAPAEARAAADRAIREYADADRVVRAAAAALARRTFSRDTGRPVSVAVPVPTRPVVVPVRCSRGTEVLAVGALLVESSKAFDGQQGFRGGRDSVVSAAAPFADASGTADMVGARLRDAAAASGLPSASVSAMGTRIRQTCPCCREPIGEAAARRALGNFADGSGSVTKSRSPATFGAVAGCALPTGGALHVFPPPGTVARADIPMPSVEAPPEALRAAVERARSSFAASRRTPSPAPTPQQAPQPALTVITYRGELTTTRTYDTVAAAPRPGGSLVDEVASWRAERIARDGPSPETEAPTHARRRSILSF